MILNVFVIPPFWMFYLFSEAVISKIYKHKDWKCALKITRDFSGLDTYLEAWYFRRCSSGARQIAPHVVPVLGFLFASLFVCSFRLLLVVTFFSSSKQFQQQKFNDVAKLPFLLFLQSKCNLVFFFLQLSQKIRGKISRSAINIQMFSSASLNKKW